MDNMSDDKSSKLVPILLVGLVGLAFAVGVLWQKVVILEKGKTSATTTDTAQATTPPTASLDQIKGLFGKDLIKFGTADAKLIFVEVSDPSCPYCGIASGVNKALIKQFDTKGDYVAPVPEMEKLVAAGKASFVYIYSPGHGNGEVGMRALYCSFEQNKFWEAEKIIMSDAGYALLNDTVKNDVSQSQKVVDLLKNVVDAAKLKACIDGGKYTDRLTSDAQLASSLGVQGTPGFFVNETNFAGAYSFTQMKSLVDKQL